jgi:hypothetical protein
MEIFGNKIQQNSANNYYCFFCDYKTCRKYNYDTHLISTRHSKNTAKEKFGNKIQQKFSNSAFSCEICNKEFQTASGLWKHKIKCKNNMQDTQTHSENNNKDDIIQLLIKQNNDLIKEQYDIKQIILEIVKNGNNSTNIMNNNINSNNKTFNLQVFLNETCKDAMNITDFVNSIQLQLSDLENVGKVGYIEGISNIIIKNLKALDVEKRPVHCTDQKREVIYVKEDNIWEKEDETNKQLRKAIKLMAHKNICMLKAFREKYPDFDDGDSRRSTQYNKIVIEAMGGKGDNEYEKDTKIIKKIAKVVGIEKS